MRSTILRTVSCRALAALCAAALAAVPALDSRADEASQPTVDRIAEARLDAGYRTLHTSDDRSFLFPYDPLESGAVLSFDALYLTPGFGTLQLESGYLDEKAWDATVEYNHGADLDLRAATRAFTHEDKHRPPVPESKGTIEVESTDANPGAHYRDERRESTASLKLRAPGYPAHLRASGRIATHEGDQQLRYFFRSCSTHICHVNSRTRTLDQETREFTIGADAHAGPVDVAYSHSARTFRDFAPDPVDAIGDISSGLPAGNYVHDVNPDLSSSADTVTLNTNLTNKVVLSALYAGGEQENETSDVGRRTRTAGGTLSWRLTPAAFVVGRYVYDEERSNDLGAEARALREANNEAEAEGSHQHAVEPERTRHTAELTARLSPLAKLDLTPRLRYRTLERNAIIERADGAFDESSTKTKSTLAALEARCRVTPQLALDATLGNEWTDDPIYALESTSLLRYGLGGTWTPLPEVLLRLSWQGFRGENDNQDALQHAYAEKIDVRGLERTVNGDAFMALAVYTPAKELSLSASWSLADNGVEQDMLFGSAADPKFSFLSPDTEWNGKLQLVDLQARWAASRRLTLTAEGMWIDNFEDYDPTIPQTSGLEQLSTVDFTKLYATLQAEVSLSETFGVTLAAFWARFDDQVDDAGDGTVTGLVASVSFRW